jgi:hypothetical protein
MMSYRGRKPRIFKTYYPKCKKSFWRVSPRPRAATDFEQFLWKAAHSWVWQQNIEQEARTPVPPP